MKNDLHNTIDDGYRVRENWKQAVEAAVKKIIAKYYQTSPSLRSAFLLLKLVEQTWKRIDENLFDSSAHYYIVLAKMIDHLLRFLHPVRDGNCCPFLLFERMEYVSKQLKEKIILDIDVGYSENGGYAIRKFMLEEDEQFQNKYKQMALIICKEVFQKLPAKMEFYSLLDGTCSVVAIAEQDYKQALQNMSQKNSFFLKQKSLVI